MAQDMAIVEILKEFKGMLWGQRLNVYTDHKNLTRDGLGLNSLTAKSFWREQNSYFLIGTYSFST